MLTWSKVVYFFLFYFFVYFYFDDSYLSYVFTVVMSYNIGQYDDTMAKPNMDALTLGINRTILSFWFQTSNGPGLLNRSYQIPGTISH